MNDDRKERTMRKRGLIAAFALAAAALVAGCGGGSTSAPAINTGAPNPTATPTATPVPPPATSASGTLTTSTSASTALTLGPVGLGESGTVRVPASNPASTANVVFNLNQPANVPTPAAFRRLPQSIGGAALTPVAYFQLTFNPGTTTASWPGFSITFGAGQTLPNPANTYIAVFDPSNSAAGFTTLEGPASAAGNVFTWNPPPPGPVTFVASNTYTFVVFTTTSTLATPSPTPSPSPTPVPPTPTPVPTPTPGVLTLSATSASFTAAGQTATINATETAYTGPITATNGTPSCSGIATVTPASGTGPTTSFTVTAVAAGVCSLSISDNHGGSAGVNVTVTTTSGSISGVKRQR